MRLPSGSITIVGPLCKLKSSGMCLQCPLRGLSENRQLFCAIFLQMQMSFFLERDSNGALGVARLDFRVDRVFISVCLVAYRRRFPMAVTDG